MVRADFFLHLERVVFIYLITFSALVSAQTEADDFLIERQSATENNEVFLQTTVDKNQVYVQESLIYSIKLYYTLAFERGASFSQLDMSEAAFNKLGDDLNYTETIDGTLYTVNESRFVIFPQRSGEFRIEPMRFRAFTQTRATRSNPNLQTTAQRQTIELFSQEHLIDVQPVPSNYPSPNWLPSSNIRISESWSRSLDDMRIGDSVVRTIQVDAADIYASMLLNLDFTSESNLRYYPAEAQQVDITELSGVSSGHTQNITLVATEAGKFTLAAVEIPWWNTETDSLEYVSLPSQDFDILTVDGQRLEETQSSSTIENRTSGFWRAINLNLLLFIAVLLLISTLFFAPALQLPWRKTQKIITKIKRSKNQQKNRPIQKFPNINSSFKQLKQACEEKNSSAIAEYFLLWGQAYFQNNSFNSIDNLSAEFKQKDLAQLINNLQDCLYSENSNTTFAFNEFQQVVTSLHRTRKVNIKKASPYNLPPLYRN